MNDGRNNARSHNLSLRLRELVFLGLDKLLPRDVARWPYLIALQNVAIIERYEVWARNSFLSNQFVFGISDLDLSALIDSSGPTANFDEVNNYLKQSRKLFPFIGELNLYALEDLNQVAALMNFYELERDPILKSKIKVPMNPSLDVEKIVFLLRMLHSDRKKLVSSPVQRQKKWKGHFESLGLEVPSFINKDDVIKVLISFLGEEIISPLEMLLSENFQEQKVFRNEELKLWRYLYPHIYLWEKIPPRSEIDELNNSLFKAVTLRQIHWEIVGIYTQRYWLKKNLYQEHVLRLIKVHELISGDKDDQLHQAVRKLLSIDV